MLKETVEIKVDYEKAGVSSEGCAPVLDCYYNTLTEEIGRKKHKAIIICPGGCIQIFGCRHMCICAKILMRQEKISY